MYKSKAAIFRTSGPRKFTRLFAVFINRHAIRSCENVV